MILTKLLLKDVRRYSGEQIIKFPPPQDGRRVYLVGGYNGTGKTTIFDSINACLFASQADPMLKAKDITRTNSRKNSNEMVVEIEFQHESQTYTLNRQWTRRPGPSAYSINSVSLRSLFQNRDSNDSSIDEDEIADFMSSLIPYETRHLFLFDGERVQSYIDEASDSVKDAIERLLGLHLYIQLQEDIKRVEQELQQERRSHDVSEDLLGKQDIVDRNEVQIRSIERRRKELRRSSADAKSEYARLQTEETRLQGVFDPILQAKRRELEALRDTLMSDTERHEKAIADLLPNEVISSWFWPEFGEAAELSSRGANILPATTGELADFLYRNRRPISDALKSDSLERINDALKVSLGDSAEIDMYINMSLGIDHIVRLIENGNDKLTFHPEQLQMTRSELNRADHEINSLPSADSIDIDVKSLHEEMEGWRTAQIRHEESLKALAHERDRLETECDSLKNDIERLTHDKQMYRSLSDTIDVCRQIRDVLEDFVNDYRSTRIGQLQSIANQKFRELTNSPGLIDAIEIDRNSVELKLKRSDSEMLAEEQSAGQKEVLAFSLIASVVELSNRQVPAIIDTPLARLDMRHRKNVLRQFFPNLGRQVIILATDTEIGREEVEQLSPILATRHHLHLDSQTGCTTIRDGYLDE